MNNPAMTLLLVGMVTCASPATVCGATSLAFGPWNFVGETQSGSVDLSSGSGVLEFTVSFDASGTFRPADGTPNSSLESYTFKYALVEVSLGSADGILGTDPLFITLNDVSGNVMFQTPATGSPSEWGDIPYTISLVSRSVEVPFSGAPIPGGEEFTVSWTSLSAMSAAGGKGIESFTQNPQLSGELKVVPEPSTYALSGIGLVLLAFACWRRG